MEGLQGALLELAPELCPLQQRGVPGTTECTKCPDNAVCDGSTSIAAPPGYWRPRGAAKAAHRCEVPEACDGDEHCHVGYTNLLCSECATGYRPDGGALCTACESTAADGIKTTFLGLVLFVVIGVFAIAAMRIYDVEQFDQFGLSLNDTLIATLFVLCRLWISHMQLASFIPALELEFPRWVHGLLAIVGEGFLASTKLHFVNCVLPQDATDALMLQLILLALLVLVLCVVAVGIVVQGVTIATTTTTTTAQIHTMPRTQK